MDWESSISARSVPITSTWAGEYYLHNAMHLHGAPVCSSLVVALELTMWLPLTAFRKNFERHFQESRHAFGMRALGLPNTKHFHEITRIEDALSCKSAFQLSHYGKVDFIDPQTLSPLFVALVTTLSSFLR